MYIYILIGKRLLEKYKYVSQVRSQPRNNSKSSNTELEDFSILVESGTTQVDLFSLLRLISNNRHAWSE